MSIFKFLICWWHKTHIFAKFYDEKGKPYAKCIRCGYQEDPSNK